LQQNARIRFQCAGQHCAFPCAFEHERIYLVPDSEVLDKRLALLAALSVVVTPVAN